MSAIDPNAIGAIFVIAAFAIFGFYVWQDMKKRSFHSSTSVFSSKHEQSGYRCKNCHAPVYSIGNGGFKCDHCGHVGFLKGSRPIISETLRDPYQEGYETELGRQDALREIRKQKERDAERKRIENNLFPNFLFFLFFCVHKFNFVLRIPHV